MQGTAVEQGGSVVGFFGYLFMFLMKASPEIQTVQGFELTLGHPRFDSQPPASLQVLWARLYDCFPISDVAIQVKQNKFQQQRDNSYDSSKHNTHSGCTLNRTSQCWQKSGFLPNSLYLQSIMQYLSLYGSHFLSPYQVFTRPLLGNFFFFFIWQNRNTASFLVLLRNLT